MKTIKEPARFIPPWVGVHVVCPQCLGEYELEAGDPVTISSMMYGTFFTIQCPNCPAKAHSPVPAAPVAERTP